MNCETGMWVLGILNVVAFGLLGVLACLTDVFGLMRPKQITGVTELTSLRSDGCPRCAGEIEHSDGLVDVCPHCGLERPLALPRDEVAFWRSDDAVKNCWDVLQIHGPLNDCPNANFVEAKYIQRMSKTRTDDEVGYVMRAWEECGKRMCKPTLRFPHY